MTEELFKAQLTDMLSVGAAAAELRISRRRVEYACRAGTLRAVRLRGHWWIHASWAEEYRLWRIRQGRREGAGRAWSKGTKGLTGRPPGRSKSERVERVDPDCSPRPASPPIIEQPATKSVPVTVISFANTGRASPPALANPKVQPRPKSSWLPKKERGRVEEGRV